MADAAATAAPAAAAAGPAGLRHYLLQGVEVPFPYEAYACQKVYMERVIACLQAVRAPAPAQGGGGAEAGG